MNELNLLSDKQLIEQVAKCEHAAFAELVRRYLASLVKFSVRYTLSFSCSEDIVQDSLLRVWTHAGQWSASKGSVKSWLFKIVYNATIDFLRKKKRDAVVGGLEQDISSEPHSLDKTFLQTEQQQWFQQALAELPERQRTALCLFMNNGLSVAEVSEVLDLNLEATSSLLARAKRSLKNKRQQDSRLGVC